MCCLAWRKISLHIVVPASASSMLIIMLASQVLLIVILQHQYAMQNKAPSKHLVMLVFVCQGSISNHSSSSSSSSSSEKQDKQPCMGFLISDRWRSCRLKGTLCSKGDQPLITQHIHTIHAVCQRCSGAALQNSYIQCISVHADLQPDFGLSVSPT